MSEPIQKRIINMRRSWHTRINERTFIKYPLPVRHFTGSFYMNEHRLYRRVIADLAEWPQDFMLENSGRRQGCKVGMYPITVGGRSQQGNVVHE